MFKNKYRIVTEYYGGYDGYRLQEKKWWWPGWHSIPFTWRVSLKEVQRERDYRSRKTKTVVVE